MDREVEDLEADRAEAVSEEEDPVDRSVADREDPAGISVVPGWAGDRARLTADRPEDPTTGGFPWGCGCCLPVIGILLLALLGVFLFAFLL